MAGVQIMNLLQNLMESGMEESCRILGDLMLTNSQLFDISEFSVQKRHLLKMYADTLFADQQFARAIFYYQQALKMAPVDNDLDIQWMMYKCNMEMKKFQAAMDILTSIPAKSRNLKMTLSLAKLFHYYKKDSHSAVVYYRLVLTENPLVIEAALALLSLGTTFGQLEMIFNHHHPHFSLISMPWFTVWLRIHANIANHSYTDAVNEYKNLTAMGFKASPELNSLMGWNMAKLCKRNAAVELFKLARNRDPYLLSHTDTYARLLHSKSATPNSAQVADTALLASPKHFECWIAKLWSIVRKISWKEQPLDSPSVTTLGDKVLKLSEAAIRSVNGERDFLFGAICSSKQAYEDAITHYNNAIKKDPSFFEAYESLLRSYMLSRNYKAAFSAMKVGIKHIKIPAQKLYLEAIVLANKNEYRARAKACLEASITEDPSLEKAAVSLCMIHRQEKNPSSAIELLKRIFQVYESANLRVEAGRSYLAMRKLTDALEQYQMAQRLDPDHKEAILGIQQIEGILQEGVYDHGEEEEREGGVSFDEEEENRMDDSEEILVLGSRESLEGAREVGDTIPSLVHYEEY